MEEKIVSFEKYHTEKEIQFKVDVMKSFRKLFIFCNELQEQVLKQNNKINNLMGYEKKTRHFLE